MTTPTIKPNRKSTFHRDGTVSLWDCTRQGWTRTASPSDALLATLPESERRRVLRHTGREAAPPRTVRIRTANVGQGFGTVGIITARNGRRLEQTRTFPLGCHAQAEDAARTLAAERGWTVA